MKLQAYPIIKTMKTAGILCLIGVVAASFVISPLHSNPAIPVAEEKRIALNNDSLLLADNLKNAAISMENYGHLYTGLGLEELGLSQKVFEYALKGMGQLDKKGKLKHRIISIVDFSQSSDKKRLYVIDLDQEALLYNTYVSHGKNTGTKDAQSFSNKAGTHKSSLGFYITANTYNGSNGYSLRLHGMEKGFNDQAFRRAIVVHGANYVSESYIDRQGYLGRSQGCPAVPSEIAADLINDIKDGTCLFIYHSSQQYPYRSSFLK